MSWFQPGEFPFLEQKHTLKEFKMVRNNKQEDLGDKKEGDYEQLWLRSNDVFRFYDTSFIKYIYNKTAQVSWKSSYSPIYII